MLGNYGAADAMTLNGVARFVADNMERQARDELSAVEGTQKFLNTFSFDASQLPYHRDLATSVYAAGLQGDEDLETNRASSSSAPSSSWWDVFKPFVTQIGMGVGGRIAGQNPWAQPMQPAPAPPPGMPAWAKLALAGGGVLVGTLLIGRLLRR